MQLKRRRACLRLLAIALLLVALAAWGVYAWLFVDLPSLDALGHNLAAPSTRLYDRHGRLLYEISDPRAGRHTVVPLERIPLALQQATVATEDASFYSNPGVDVRAILRAVWINLQGGEVRSGGSTITQQVARNLLLDPQERQERTLTRKLRETILAWRLARAYSKDDILTLYLNQTYYGHLAFGVEAAARAYFGKPVEQLDLAESALLAGLPQSPVAYDPLTSPDSARARQAVVLDLMVKQGTIAEDDARLAKAEKLRFAAAPFPIEAPHFVMYVWSLLEREYGEDLYRKGLSVRTTLDLDWQRAAEAIARRHLARLKEEQPASNVSNAALVALDPQTGEILAMLGSPNYFDAQISGAVNVALAPRQPGSAIKPLTYAAAFSGETPWTPATMVLDVRSSFPTREDTPYVPENYDRRYHGPVLVREALASSYNIPAVKALEHIGLERLIQLARQLGISTFTDAERFGLALTLGGGEVRLLELTAAYAAFANGGYRVQPTAILDAATDGNAWWMEALHAPSTVHRPPPREAALDPRVAHLITDILSDDTARAPAFGHNSVLNLSRPAAAKTGTTTDWRDNWTVGYTPDLSVGVWVGNADNTPMYDVSGITGAGPIWHDFIEQVLKGRPARAFEPPPGLVRAEVCALSGLLPTPYCPHKRTELFIAGSQPTQADTFYRPVEFDVATGLPASANTPPERTATRVALVLPPEARDWARSRGGDPRWLVLTEDDMRLAASSLLTLISPDPGAIFRISPTLPRAEQRIAIEAQVGIQLSEVTLLVDGEALAQFDEPPYRALWTLMPGSHTFQAVGKDAQGQTVTSTVVRVEVR
jgi:penicillin-binding protein 1C